MEYGVSVGPAWEKVSEVPEEFDFVEVAIGEKEVRPEKIDREELREDLEEQGLDLYIHLPFRQPVATEVPELNQAVIEYFERLLEFSADLEVVKAVVHPNMREEESMEQAEILEEQIKKLKASGDEYGIEVVFENVGQFDTLEMFDLADIIEEAEAPMCFDTGHGFAEAGQEITETFLENKADLISHIHAQDTRENEDLHLPIGSAQIDFEALFSKLEGFDGSICLELFTDDEDYLLLSKQKVEEAFSGDS
ncbi:MAG: sugar phosphate isomerase/epimerase family protein [Candidatus Nanohalobium sp.]